MAIDPGIAELLELAHGSEVGDVADLTPSEVRAFMKASKGAQSEPGAEVGEVDAVTVETSQGPIGLRVYRPAGGDQQRPAGALVWMHGGGWVAGDLETADPTARDLCAGAGIVVISVDYPLAPEHPYPAAPEACFDVVSWVSGHAGDLGVDGSRLAAGGDSAGGNLAAVVSLLARDRAGPPIAFQLLVYPAVDQLASFPSVRDNGEGYLLTAEAISWFTGHYLSAGDPDPRDPTISPIYAADVAGLPPALVLTAELDPLRDEGEAYAVRLRQAQVPVEATRYDGMVHGFFAMTKVTPRASEAMAEAVGALRRALA